MEDTIYRCTPDGIVETEDPSFAPAERQKRVFNGTEAVRLTSDSTLVLKDVDSGEKREIQVDFEGIGSPLYKAGCQWKGKIYGGGGGGRAHLFSFNPDTGKMADLGRVTGGRIQVYEIVGMPAGLFLSSYSGCHIDFYDPRTEEHKHIAALVRDYDQERGLQLAVGPDEMIYLASRPIKGHLGGALTRINPRDFSVTCWRNIIEKHSLHAVVSVPETNEVFFTTSVCGGSSSIPTKEQGYIGFWDVENEEVAWKAAPIPEDPSYGHAARAENGLIYVQAHDDVVVFDPVRREVVEIISMPVESMNKLSMADRPAGPEGMIFFLAEGAVWGIDPSDNSFHRFASHTSIKDGWGVFVTKEGVLYYRNGSHLWRVDLYPDTPHEGA